MRATGSMFFALVLAMPSQLAAADNSGPLAPGKPAGVQQAQNNHQLEYILVGVSALVATGLGIILIKKYTSKSAASAGASAGASSVASATST
ncbi:MAG TPA: hypothetical protein VNW15_00110 [Rhizomicrobium sp.]|jgi:hypothetical protein|nr:hypothetical protein [Rhizomicrobium sp.]